MRALSPGDYNHFVALYAIQPWGAERDNFHAAMLLSQTANLHRRKGSRPIDLSRFMLGHKTSTKDEAARILALRAAIHSSKEIH